MSDSDDDIDALMSSVLGHDGTPAAFPASPPLAEVVPIRRRRAPARQASVTALSAALAAELKKNEPPPKLVDPREAPVRFSSLKHMANSPLHYKWHVQHGSDDTMCMRLGRGAHALVLGTPVILYPGPTRQGKRWDEFARQHADKEILIGSEWDKANGVNDAIRSHPLASELLFDGATLEETIEWECLGKKCTSRPDSRRGTSAIADLKTTRCAEPDKFRRDATFRAYHAQMDFYGRAMEHRFGQRPEQTFCIAVESKAPYAITVFELMPDDLAEGEKCWRIWFERLLVCQAANHWPAYTDAIVPFDVPADAGALQLTIGGETFDYDDNEAP